MRFCNKLSHGILAIGSEAPRESVLLASRAQAESLHRMCL